MPGKKKEEKEKEKKKGLSLAVRSFLSSPSSVLLSPRGRKEKKTVASPEVKMDLSKLSEKNIKSITKLQAGVRGYLVRRGLRISGTQEQQRIQTKSLKLLMRLEEKYVDHLKLLIDEYLIPCRQICKGNRKKLKKVDSLFIDVEGMYKFHVNFCKLIQNYFNSWPIGQRVGYAISMRLLDFQFYEKYVNNIPYSKTAFKELEKNKSPITELIKTINQRRKAAWDNPGHVFRDFRTLLKLPLKHLAQYKSPLKKLMISTPENHPDYRYRVAAAATFREIGLYLKHIFTESVAMQDMGIFEGRLISGPDFKVMAPNRKIVRQGEMFVNGKSARRVYLCNDICVITRVMNKVTYSYEEHFELKGAKILRLSISSDGTKQVFTITTSDERAFTFSPVTLGKCKSWQKSFEDAVSKRNDQVFGLSVEEIVQRDQSPVPRIIFSIVYRLNRGLTEDKVFRAAGDSKALRSLKRRFNHHLKDLDLSTSYSQDVAALLLPYLESLPEPIFTLDYHDDIVSGKDAPTDEEVFKYFVMRVSKLPIANQHFFEFLVLLLHRAAFLSKQDESLTTIELAVLFSPLLFKPAKWNLNYCYKMPRIARIFERVLCYPEEIFPLANEPLPKTIDEFLYADLFGDWWRRLRMGEDKIINHLSKKENLKELISRLVVKENDPTSEACRKQSHAAALSCLVLTSDKIKPTLLADNELMTELFKQVNENTGRELTLKFFRDTLEALIESHPIQMTDYLESTPKSLNILLSHIHAGNIFSIFQTIALKSVRYQYPKHHKLIHLWFSKGLEMFLDITPEMEYNLEPLRHFMDIVFTDNTFLNSSYATQLIEQIKSQNIIDTLYKSAFSTDDQSSIECLLLIQSFITKRERLVSEDDDDEDDDDEEENDESSQSESSSEKSDNSESSQSHHSKIVQLFYPLPDLIPTIINATNNALPNFLNCLFSPLSGEKPRTFGLKRCRLIEILVQFVTSGEKIESLSSEALSNFWKLMFLYPSNNIAQNLITDLLIWELKSNETNMKAIEKAKIPDLIIKEVLSISSNSPSCYAGHLLSLGVSLVHSQYTSVETTKHSDWKKFRDKIMQYQEESHPDDVKRKNRNLVTDRYEDRI